MLELVNLKQTYFYGSTAIFDLNLKADDGEKIAVLSKSGGGKTSLLKCIAGLFPADSGQIIIDGNDVTNLKTKNRDVRLIYDDGGLIRKRTVKFNLEYPLRLRKMDRDERRFLAYSVAQKYKLEPFYKEYAFRLFEPEIIALALARTELRESRITLIDNIFALTNGIERVELFNKYLPVLKRINGTVLFATDSVEEALSFGDRVVVLNAGYHQQTDTPEKLRDNPLTFSVEELINHEKTKMTLGVVDGVVEINHLKIGLPDNYSSDEVILSYKLKIDEKGVDFKPIYRRYIGAGIYQYENEAGDSLLFNENITGVKVSIDPDSIKLFDRISEKILTHYFI